jgi:hypothetical protein
VDLIMGLKTPLALRATSPVVHIGRNSQKSANYKNFACQYQKSQIFFVLPLFINQYESIYRPYEQTYNK